MELYYTKMTGSGNDFIVVNNMDRELDIGEIHPFISKICARGVSEGADGFIMLESSEEADFMWHFYNADGSEAEMCGNGSRCAARFAYTIGAAGKEMRFKTLAGIIRAEIMEGVNVKVQLTTPHSLVTDRRVDLADSIDTYAFVNTGVPHTVLFMDDVEAVDVNSLGRSIRNHAEFAPAGSNVNFVTIIDEHTIRLRTYERGVEAETLACGTGAAASVIAAISKGMAVSPVTVHTSGNIDMKVYYDSKEVFLEGEARFLSTGTLCSESMEY